MNPSSIPLRETLRSALSSRSAAIRLGRSKRKDLNNVNAAMGRIETFLRGYPYASDQRVREWCLAHLDDVAIVVPGNQHRTLARLIRDELELRSVTGQAS